MKAAMLVLLREGGLVLNREILLLVDICMSKSLVMLPLSRMMLVGLMGTVLVTVPVKERAELLLSEDLKCKGWEGVTPPRGGGSGSRPGSLVLVMALAAGLMVLVVTVRKTTTLAREGESLARAQIVVCFR